MYARYSTTVSRETSYDIGWTYLAYVKCDDESMESSHPPFVTLCSCALENQVVVDTNPVSNW